MAAKKLRVYELARELNLDNSEVIRELQHMGVPVTSHSNTVEDRLADQLRKKLGPSAEEEVVAKPKAKAEPEVEEVVAAPVKEEPKPEPKPVAPPAPAPKVETKPAEPVAEAKPAPKTVPPPPPPPAPVSPPAPPAPPAAPAAEA